MRHEHSREVGGWVTDVFKATVRRVVDLSDRTKKSRCILSPQERAEAYEAIMIEADEICRILRQWKEVQPVEPESGGETRRTV